MESEMDLESLTYQQQEWNLPLKFFDVDVLDDTAAARVAVIDSGMDSPPEFDATNSVAPDIDLQGLDSEQRLSVADAQTEHHAEVIPRTRNPAAALLALPRELRNNVYHQIFCAAHKTSFAHRSKGIRYTIRYLRQPGQKGYKPACSRYHDGRFNYYNPFGFPEWMRSNNQVLAEALEELLYNSKVTGTISQGREYPNWADEHALNILLYVRKLEMLVLGTSDPTIDPVLRFNDFNEEVLRVLADDLKVGSKLRELTIRFRLWSCWHEEAHFAQDIAIPIDFLPPNFVLGLQIDRFILQVDDTETMFESTDGSGSLRREYTDRMYDAIAREMFTLGAKFIVYGGQLASAINVYGTWRWVALRQAGTKKTITIMYR